MVYHLNHLEVHGWGGKLAHVVAQPVSGTLFILHQCFIKHGVPVSNAVCIGLRTSSTWNRDVCPWRWHHFAFPNGRRQGLCHTLAKLVMYFFFDSGHAPVCEVLSHWGFDFLFSSDEHFVLCQQNFRAGCYHLGASHC